MATTPKHPRGLTIKRSQIFKRPLPKTPLCLVAAVIGCSGIVSDAARADPSTLIEENFEEAVLGARIDPGKEGITQTGISPSAGGMVMAWIGDEAEIVSGWDGLALQLRETHTDGSLRLLFRTADGDLISNGNLEVSMDFRVDGDHGDPYNEILLSLSLVASGRPTFCLVNIMGSDLHLAASEGREDPPHKTVRIEKGFRMELNSVYRLTLLLALDKSTYDIQLKDKKTDELVFEIKNRTFPPIPDLDISGIGTHLLNIRAGLARASETTNPVTIDNILVRHLRP